MCEDQIKYCITYIAEVLEQMIETEKKRMEE